MATRKQTPDLMGELIGKPKLKPGSPPAKGRGRATARKASKPAKPKKEAASQPAGTEPEETPAPVKAKPIKATFYLSAESIQILEDLHYQMRREQRERGPESRLKISKSLIVENAIRDHAQRHGAS